MIYTELMDFTLDTTFDVVRSGFIDTFHQTWMFNPSSEGGRGLLEPPPRQFLAVPEKK